MTRNGMILLMMFTSYQIRKEEAYQQLQEYVYYFRDCGSPVIISVVITTAEGILTSVDANVIASNGGGISLSKDWEDYSNGNGKATDQL